MSAPAGYGQAVHSGKCAMHKLGIQVLPSLDVMAIVDANDTLRQVAMEDTLALFTIEESAIGFKKSLAFQPHGIKQSRGHTLQGGHVEHRFMLADFTVAAGFNNILAFQPCGIKPSRGSSGEGIWITTRFGGHARVRTVEEFAAGFMLAFQMHGIKQNRGPMGFMLLLNLMSRYHFDEGVFILGILVIKVAAIEKPTIRQNIVWMGPAPRL
ncbi:hypothetical protein AK812_SmicGene13826 [Symbiodinium microadriaticum]|uniref:Uncharacterized protein n=1 Tax=Symbiodinium microadriaticum TaxID=2951 RepID=A0A1Q9E781_SYMMI|nr:hypothetical protein AK812_SmicGene13826 [Symbiodinium microadriaticum]